MTIDLLNHGLVQNIANFRTSSSYLLMPRSFSNPPINKLLLVFWFNLKGIFLRLGHVVSWKAPIDTGLIPFPLYCIPIYCCGKC